MNITNASGLIKPARDSHTILDIYSTKPDKPRLSGNPGNTDVKARLQKRAKRKAKSLPTFQELAGLDNERRPQYERAISCANIIEVGKAGVIKTYNFCNNRLCPVCHAIRQARYIDKYSPLVEGRHLYHLTSTLRAIQTDDPGELREHITRMERELAKAVEAINLRNKRNGNPEKSVDAIRKIEIGYSVQNGYTPHFHVLVSGSENAEQILEEWLERFDSEASRKAQDLVSIKSDEIKNVFGYAIKLFADKEKIPTTNLDIILAAMHGKRAIQPYGIFRGVKVQEDPNKGRESYKDATLTPGGYEWNNEAGTWINSEGEPIV